MFYDTAAATEPNSEEPDLAVKTAMPTCRVVGQLGGAAAGTAGRIKDFEILKLPARETNGNLILVTASSDGVVRLWTMDGKDLSLGRRIANNILDDINGKLPISKSNVTDMNGSGPKKVGLQQSGRLLGVYETGNRITCLKAFIMTGQPGHINSVAGESRVGMQSNGDSEA